MATRRILLGLGIALAFTTAASATSLTYLDTAYDWSTGNPLTYALTLTAAPGDTAGSGAFTVTTTNNTTPLTYYAVEFDFKFAGGRAQTNITNVTGPTAAWVDLDYYSTYKGVYKNESSFNGLSSDAAGFVVGAILYDGTAPSIDDYLKGIVMNGDATTYTFTFDFAITGGVLREDAIPFQGIFFAYDENSEANMLKYAGQFSEDLSAPVPEPTSMVLLGTGLLGLAGYGRKRKK